jgi:excinuclease ABC subunit C
VDEIAEVPGIGPRTAEAIKTALDRSDRPRTVSINTSTGEIIDSDPDPANEEA